MSVLQHAARWALVLSLALSTQSVLVVQTLFVVRQGYIAEHLCINRDHPEKRCDGMCFLADRVAETQHHEGGEHEEAPRPERAHAFNHLLPARVLIQAPPPRPVSYRAADAAAPETPFVGGLFRPPRTG